jgi:hypothetical protein
MCRMAVARQNSVLHYVAVRGERRQIDREMSPILSVDLWPALYEILSLFPRDLLGPENFHRVEFIIEQLVEPEFDRFRGRAQSRAKRMECAEVAPAYNTPLRRGGAVAVRGKSGGKPHALHTLRAV